MSEVVVVGGGVAGASIAYHLAKLGRRVTLLERDAVAAHASGASAGGVRQLGRDPREMPLAIESVARWRNLERELDADVEFRMGGQILVTEHECDVPTLQDRVASHRAQGVDIRFVDGGELRDIAPHLAPTAQWGMYTDNDGQANARLTTMGFANAARRLGASIREGVRVESVVSASGQITGVKTSAGMLACDWLVIAAGAWSNVLLEPLGIRLPIETMALQMMAVGPCEPMLAPTVGASGRKLSLKQVPDGHFVIGGGWPGDVDRSGLRGTTRLESIRASIDQATAILPRLGILPLARTWIGLEALAMDEIPILGPLPCAGNLTVAAGFSGHGFAISPMVGQLLAELIDAGAPSMSLDAFAYERFANIDSRKQTPRMDAG